MHSGTLKNCGQFSKRKYQRVSDAKDWIRMNPKSSAESKTFSTKIAVLFLVPGTLSLTVSILYSSQIPAFVGLGLVFWGALFLFIRPVKYVTGDIVFSAALSSYSTLDRIIKDLGYKGDAYYIPPYPKDVYLPDHLKGLKEPVVFLSANKDSNKPSIEEIAGSKFLLGGSKGILVASPGAGLLFKIEKELNADFTKIKLPELCEILPRVIAENLSMARELELLPDETGVRLTLLDSLYSNLYSRETGLKSVSLVGCPLASAVACAIAEATGKPVIIQKQEISIDGMSIKMWYRVVQE